ncbi:lysostaphin resistance A-like protein [Pseudonocardia zijingensis]|jgi:membrane protease YdiL (CAAX protease family)|uniref:Type II CAAX endopeptidase family protein n=1 Tax=Pseudonocardia zijingensis TaxID=153376 RepID=A0ABN1PD21_9PSEU
MDRGRAGGALVGRLLRLVGSRPLTSYVVMTFALSWVWFGLALGVWGLPLQGAAGFLGTLLGPCLAGFALTALLRGWAGVRHLLRRLVLWRVAPGWYLIAVLAWPALLVAAVLALPGSPQAGGPPPVLSAAGFLGLYLSILVFGGPLGEEPGWRGFALPGLQERCGPLVGALLLGVLHGTWHLPIYLLIPGYNGAPPGLAAALGQFLLFVVGVTAGSVAVTWLFNNTRGSLLIAVLHHAATNTAGIVVSAVLPGTAVLPALGEVRLPLQIAAALLIIAATRGRLSYERYRRETAADGPWPQASGEPRGTTSPAR